MGRAGRHQSHSSRCQFAEALSLLAGEQRGSCTQGHFNKWKSIMTLQRTAYVRKQGSLETGTFLPQDRPLPSHPRWAVMTRGIPSRKMRTQRTPTPPLGPSPMLVVSPWFGPFKGSEVSSLRFFSLGIPLG